MKTFKKILCLLLVVVMCLTSAPMQAFTGIDLPDWFSNEAEAAGVSGYSGYAAAEYARAWWSGRNNAIWSDYDLWGGDCANFVAQALYAGGIPMTPSWYFHKRIGLNAGGYSTERTETWTLVNKLYKYLISIGGQAIDAPSSSQISVGDVIVYDWDLNGRYDHSAIVVDIVNGTPKIACHYRRRSASTIYENRDRYTTDWTLGGDIRGIKLIKLYGATCWNNSPTYDAYMVTVDGLSVRKGPGTGYGYITSVGSNYIIHVTERQGNWGKCKGKGYEGWVYLPNNTRYITHVESIKVTHTMGAWYTVTKATCVDPGLERRDCQKCDYYETQVITCGGHKAITPATCLDASFCSACGAKISDALGHDLGNWYFTVEPTCTKEGSHRKDCSRCDYFVEETVPALGHNYVGTAQLGTCTTSGTTYYECSRCGDSYINNSEWSGYVVLTDAQIAKLATFPAGWYTSRTEYQYRDKVTKSITNTSSTATLDGWNYDHTVTNISDWGDWSGWQDAEVSASDARQVEKRVVYRYYYFTCPSCGHRHPYWNVKCDMGCNATIKESSHVVHWSTTSYASSNYKSYGSAKKYTTSVGDGGRWYFSAGNVNDTAPGTLDDSSVAAVVIKNQYKYRDRTYNYTHHFWKWGDWNGKWLTTNPAQADRDVKKRTTYNVKQFALGHDWGSVTKTMLCDYEGNQYNKEDICYITSKVCKRCGVSAEVETYKHNYPDFATEKNQYKLISDEGGYRVYRGYCRNADCVCYIDKTEKNCVFTQTVVEATCTDKGYTINTCKYHGETYESDYVDAIGHNMGEWYTVVPETCEEYGKERRDCLNSFCNCTYFEERDKAPLGHIEVTDPGYAPTCTETGLTDGEHCSRCDKILVAQEEIPALGHNEGIWVCTNEGYEDLTFNSIAEIDAHFLPLDCGTSFHFEHNCTRVCYDEVCGEWLEDHDLSAPECKWTVVETIEPTCTIEGQIISECFACGRQVIDFTDALGHLEGEAQTKYATCTEDGMVYWECQRKNCDHKEETKHLDATGHAKSPLDDDYNTSDDKMELISSVKNVCGDGSIDTYQCTHINNGARCDYTVVIGEAKDHTMSGWQLEKPPTCEETGKEINKCTNEGCTYKQERELEPIGHDYLATKTVDPTCTENGYTVYVCQNDASHTYNGDETPALGHDWNYTYNEKWKEIVTPDYDKEGLEERECNRCHITETRALPPLEKPKYTATFVVPDPEGDIVIEGETYKYHDSVTFYYGDKTINPPDLPERDGYTGEWEDYTVKNEDFYVRAIYDLKTAENESELEEKKTAVYNNGIATINLSAFAKTKNVKVSMGATPYDIVLVLDKSYSMTQKISGKTRIDTLKQVAKEFVQKVYDSTNDGEVNHRISIVAYSGGNASGLMTPGASLVKSPNTAKYKAAWLDVYSNKGILDKSINALSTSTGTRSDLGLELAGGLLSVLEEDSSRKRLVMFITDGDPTNADRSWTGGGTTEANSFHTGVANAAIDEAKQLKNTYGATVYSVGIATNNTNNMNTFMNYVSSNYPNANSLKDGGKAAPAKSYYITAGTGTDLDAIFKNIFAQQVSNTISFNKVSFFDTISKEFTLTIQQENALRESVKAEYGISDDDIIITRNEDGTTTVVINNLVPKKVYENGVQTGWGVNVKFEVSANENMLGVGTYYTNTKDAGINHNGEQVEKFEIPEGIVVSENRYIVEFTIDGETYAIYEGKFGDGVEFPDCDYAQWDPEDAEYISDGHVVIDTDVIQNYKYSTTWYVDGEKTAITYYNPGDVIVAPSIPQKEGYVIEGWSPEVPVQMPEYALTFNAVYKATHEHIYNKSAVNGSCEQGNVYTTYTCWCGDSYTETVKTTNHTYVAKIHELSDGTYVSSISCDTCGRYSDKTINYIAVYDDVENTLHDGLIGNAGNTNGNGDLGVKTDNVTTTVIDLTLLDGDKSVQPGAEEGYNIIVKIPLTEALLANKDKLMVYRLDENDNTTPIKHEVDDTYLTLYLDHFSYYVITTAAYKATDPNYAQAYCAFHGHDYDCVVTGASVDGQSYMTYTCKNCNFVYSTSKVEGGCDCSCHSSFLGRVWRFVYTILNSLFGTNLYCCPDMDKYLDDIGSMT